MPHSPSHRWFTLGLGALSVLLCGPLADAQQASRLYRKVPPAAVVDTKTGDAQGINPQPLPPTPEPVVSPGAAKSINPQPLPPKSSAVLASDFVPGGKVANPAASSKRLAMLSVLRTEKQDGAVVKAQHIANRDLNKTATAFTPHVATPMDNTSGPKVQAARTRPGNVIGASTQKPSEVKVELNNALAVALAPGIHTVNRKARGTTFTQDPAGNPVIIEGLGFGAREGTAHIYAKFKTGKVMLEVLEWTDTMITARVPPALNGELDQANVILVVAPSTGEQFRAEGFKFYAQREAVLLPRIPASFRTGAADEMTYTSPAVNGMSVEVIRGAVPTLTKTTGGVAGEGRAASLAPGQDYYNFAGLTPGFVTDNMQFSPDHTSQRCSTSTIDAVGSVLQGAPACSLKFTLRGTESANWDGDNIRVEWGIWNCDGSFHGPRSDYKLNVWVVGPKGVNPLPI